MMSPLVFLSPQRLDMLDGLDLLDILDRLDMLDGRMGWMRKNNAWFDARR